MKKEERNENPYNNNKNHIAGNRIENPCSQLRRRILWKELSESKKLLTKEERIALLEEYKHDL
jgi:hypothetical protein